MKKTNMELEKVYRAVTDLAVDLYRQGKTMTAQEVIDWINKNHPLPHPLKPYKSFRGVPQACYKRAKSKYEKEALRNAFVDARGTPLVNE